MILILYSGNRHKYELNRLFEEAKSYNNIKFLRAEDLILPPKEEQLGDIKVFYFIGSLRKIGIVNLEILADFLEKRKVKIINKVIKHYHLMNKSFFYYKMLKHNINIPEIIKINHKENYKELLKLGFPIIAKFDYVHLGNGIFLLRNEQELMTFIKKYEEKLPHIIFQKYIPYEKDIRVIVIKKPIGGMERVNPTSFKANIAQGGFGRSYTIDDEIKEISNKISKIFNIDIFAFDILIRNKVKYVIDLHIIFRFQGFEKYTGTNVAKKIIEYLNEVHSKS